MILVTGGAGFIGSNIVKGLNAINRKDIIITDDLENGDKFLNIADAEFFDYIDYRQLEGSFDKLNIELIFHQGACSSTTESNGVYMLETNYNYSKMLLKYALEKQVRFIYASSASVYGDGKYGFKEEPACERPLNIYAFSKFIFDRHVRHILSNFGHRPQVAGLRYFNVYGNGEAHKGKMASVAFHMYNQVKAGSPMRLFEGSADFLRDFIYVDDVVNVNMFLMDNPQISGIFNCGTGRAESFKAAADAVNWYFPEAAIEYIPFPKELEGKYQSYTQADMQALRNAGYLKNFMNVDSGVKNYLSILEKGR